MTHAPSLGEVLTRLYETILSRRGADPEKSYTAMLMSKGSVHCAKKFGEEAIETVIAGAGADDAALAGETADALYHLMVLLAERGVSPARVAEALAAREGVSGHDEKSARGK